MSPLWQLSVAELSKLVRDKEVSPLEISESCIRRYEGLNGTLNAIVACNHEDTIEQARRSEKRMLQNKLLSPLDGIPITIKDNIFSKGFRATWGSLLYESFEPDVDDYCVEHLRNAGAVIFGKTNTPEFALSAHTNNLIFGKTLNPWDLSLTPGGSSGGAVSSVASGMVPLAVATDAGGSIRRPCSYTGLVGLRTSTGRIQRRPGFQALVHDFQVIAPAARTVDTEGNYWCALIHDWHIACFAPDGKEIRRIKLPVQHPTMCTFGGDNYDVMYVTSGTRFLEPEKHGPQPLAGALFSIHGLGARGLPEPYFEG